MSRGRATGATAALLLLAAGCRAGHGACRAEDGCAAPPCDPAACPAGQYCDAGGGCRSCDVDQRCGPACTDCTIAGRVCDAGGARCVTPGPCTTDADCAAHGLVCTPQWGQGVCVVPGCEGKDDFTPCRDPAAARFYSVCVAQACVTPGCGDASCNTSGPGFPLPDTAQRQCYDAVAGLTGCPVQGQAFSGQDAQYGWDLIHEESERFARVEGAQPIVEDRVTGLSWEGGLAHNKSWRGAFAHCRELSAERWGGHGDWRVPDIYELESIVDAGVDAAGSVPAIDSGAFPGTITGSFWSSSSDATDQNRVWGVSFSSGAVYSLDRIYDSNDIRCVRGDPSPRPARFARSAGDEPLVLDRITGLAWQGCPAGLRGAGCDRDLEGNASEAPSTFDWEGALAYCAGLSWDGQGGWRLPSRRELFSIFDSRWSSVAQHAAIDGDAFPETPPDWFWSSTTLAHHPNQAWSVEYSVGGIQTRPKHELVLVDVLTSPVRCVRDGT